MVKVAPSTSWEKFNIGLYKMEVSEWRAKRLFFEDDQVSEWLKND